MNDDKPSWELMEPLLKLIYEFGFVDVTRALEIAAELDVNQ